MNLPSFMKKRFIFSVIIILGMPLVAQEEDYPVRNPFETSTLIDNQTIINPYKGSLQFMIYHRFGTVENGIKDLFGIYAPSNIRLALDYGVTDKIMIGVATEKDNKLQDIHWKYSILQQTRSGSMPVSLSYFGNFTIDAREDQYFYPEDDYRFIHRFSYFTQLILARKFSEMLSFQVAPSFMYFNAVEPGIGNMHAGVHVGGRAKFSPTMSAIFEYDQLLTEVEAFDVKPNIGLGLEIGTATHAFQVFAASYRELVDQKNYVFNTNDFFDGQIMIGFNITVRL